MSEETMQYSHLIALTGYAEGREQDYNDWYTWVHLRDVMRLSLSVVAAQRFRASDALASAGTSEYDFPYLCIYEVIDPAAMTRDHAPVFTDDMPVSDAYDLSRASEVYFDTIAAISREPGQIGNTYVVIERIDGAAHDPDLAEWYRCERFSRLLDLPGVIAGTLGMPNPHQMFEQPLSSLCAVYRTTDLAATAAAWSPLEGAARTLRVSLNAYERIMERLTIFDVRHPTDADRNKAADVRQRLSDRLHTGPSDTVKSEHFA